VIVGWRLVAVEEVRPAGRVAPLVGAFVTARIDR
jgi:hypothetical protein